ncbi:DNA-directed RNA polymerase I subunit RPA12-like isoform X2 [Phoenix dactylifera]|uniref:DNA-directed RNA polymerase I subunit RPA12 n=1 Tax=Phoenix dactylifera TaxID=42345 RepID=A0A8B8IZG3_PHODC|nr:DNA-directed RNA polymerase I subunit RPA12-like isoform X2 [Phoenix dactylifera]
MDLSFGSVDVDESRTSLVRAGSAGRWTETLSSFFSLSLSLPPLSARRPSSERQGMAFCEARDFLFCGMCGTLLSFDSLDFAECPLCGFKRAAKDIEGREAQYIIIAEDIRRELKIEPFVVLETTPVDEAVVNESCPQCHHPQLEYYTRQLRSADEGQTVFYECPECRHKFSVNT